MLGMIKFKGYGKMTFYIRDMEALGFNIGREFYNQSPMSGGITVTLLSQL